LKGIASSCENVLGQTWQRAFGGETENRRERVDEEEIVVRNTFPAWFI
jgi:hypothetical protein